MIYKLRLYVAQRFPVIPLFLYTTATLIGISSFFNFGSLSKIIFLSLIYLLFLFHLRVLDEFKDFEYDSKHHTHRPVQKGSISLTIISALGVINFILMWILVFILSEPPVTYLFLITLIYTGIMFKEFFLGEYLKKNITLYLISHQIVFFPLFWFFYSAVAGELWELSYLNGARLLYTIIPIVLIEIGRKIKHRYNHKGEKTDDTYAYHWGQRTTIQIFSGLILLSAILHFLIEPHKYISLAIALYALLIYIGGYRFRSILVLYSMLITTFIVLFLPLVLVF